MIDHVGDQLAGRGLGLDAGDELAAGSAHHLDLDLGKALVELLDDDLFDLGEIRRVEHQFAFCLRGSNQFGRSEFLRLRGSGRCQPKAGYTGQRGSANEDPSIHRQSSLYSCYPVRATLPCAAPRDSQLAPPMRTPSRIVCTMLKAAVLPILPPS